MPKAHLNLTARNSDLIGMEYGFDHLKARFGDHRLKAAEYARERNSQSPKYFTLKKIYFQQ